MRQIKESRGESQGRCIASCNNEIISLSPELRMFLFFVRARVLGFHQVVVEILSSCRSGDRGSCCGLLHYEGPVQAAVCKEVREEG